jgi:SNF2 family DNA or RNA helicase
MNWVSMKAGKKTLGLVREPVGNLVTAKLSGEGWKRAKNLGIERGPGNQYVVPPSLVSELFAGAESKVPDLLDGVRSLADAHRCAALSRSHNAEWLGRQAGAATVSCGFGAPVNGLRDVYPDARTGEQKQLFEYQQAGVQWLEMAKGRGILGDEMGLGKTPQALVYLQRSSLRRVLVVAPKSVVINWSREGETWAPGWRFSVASTGAQIRRCVERLPERGALVVTWGLLHRNLDALLYADFDGVVADEAHLAKNPMAKRTVALMDLAFQARSVLLLTGTPVRNRPRELWPLLHMVDPDTWRSFLPYGERFCGARDVRLRDRVVRTYDGCTRGKLEELNALTRPYMLRRRKDQVLTQLPPKTVQRLPLAVPASLTRAYRLAMDQLRAEMVSGVSPTALGLLASLRQECGLEKVDAAVDWLTHLHESKEQCVVFVYHREVRARLEAGLSKAGILHAAIVGDTPARTRQEVTDAFQNGDLDVVIGSEACKEGVTLTRARHVLFLEYWWTPGDLAQAEDRVHRYSQERPVQVTYLHLGGGSARSLDDHVVGLLTEKSAVIERINDRGGSFESRLIGSMRGEG